MNQEIEKNKASLPTQAPLSVELRVREVEGAAQEAAKSSETAAPFLPEWVLRLVVLCGVLLGSGR